MRGIVLTIYLIVTLLLVVVDRVLKVFLSAILIDGTTITLIPGFIQLRYAENTGAAFGMFQGHTTILSVLTALVLVALIYVLVSGMIKQRMGNIALTLIIAGGIGNLYDRIVNGFVVDYLEFTFVNYAVFNFADALINIGGVLIVVYLIFFDKSLLRGEKSKENPVSDEPAEERDE